MNTVVKGFELYNLIRDNFTNKTEYETANGHTWHKKENGSNKFIVVPKDGSIMSRITILDNDEFSYDENGTIIKNKKAIDNQNVIDAVSEIIDSVLKEKLNERKKGLRVTGYEIWDKLLSEENLIKTHITGGYYYQVKSGRWQIIKPGMHFNSVHGEVMIVSKSQYENFEDWVYYGYRVHESDIYEKDESTGLWGKCSNDSDLPNPLTKVFSKCFDELLNIKSTCDKKSKSKLVNETYLKVFLEDIEKAYNKAVESGEKYKDFNNKTDDINSWLGILENSPWWFEKTMCTRLSTLNFHKLMLQLGLIEKHYSKNGNLYWVPTNVRLIRGAKRNNYMINIIRNNGDYVEVYEYYDVKKIYDALLQKRSEYKPDDIYQYFMD